jgi:hypothetical protein
VTRRKAATNADGVAYPTVAATTLIDRPLPSNGSEAAIRAVVLQVVKVMPVSRAKVRASVLPLAPT